MNFYSNILLLFKITWKQEITIVKSSSPCAMLIIDEDKVKYQFKSVKSGLDKKTRVKRNPMAISSNGT